MKWVNAAIGSLLAVIATIGLVVLSDVDYLAESSDDAIVRLSWRAVGERIEKCRVPTEEEIAALPLHMQRQEICEGSLAPFQLDVSIDGAPVHSAVIRAAGAREDRPTYVFEEFRVAPGRHDLKVRFTLIEGAMATESTHAPLELEASVDLVPRRVVLVTRGSNGEGLVVRTSSG